MQHQSGWRRLGLTGSALVAAALLFSGCSGANPAEVNEAAAPFTRDDGPLGIRLSESQARCRMRVFLESDLSDQAIAAIKRGDPPAAKKPGDVEVLQDLAAELAEECLNPED